MTSARSILGSVRPRRASALGMAALALFFAACSDDTIGGPGGGSGSGEVTFYVGNAAGASPAIAPTVMKSLASSMPPVAPEQIASLEIVVSLMEAHHSMPGGSASSTAAWVGIPLDAPVIIDPTTIAAGEFEAITSASLPAGDYDNLRLIPESVTVQFHGSSSTTPIIVGNHEYAPAPATHDVTVPSGRIQIPTAHFTVDDAGGVVIILWDADETAASINATGSGKILLRPVFVEGSAADEEELPGG